MPGAQTWGADFLPGCHQGTRVLPGDTPIANMQCRHAAEQQSLELELRRRFNRRHLEERAADMALEAQIQSFETAFGMQREAPQVFDLSQETDATLATLRPESGTKHGLRLAMPGGPAAGRARCAIHRIDRHRVRRTIGIRTAT